jgi:hypothetical protein
MSSPTWIRRNISVTHADSTRIDSAEEAKSLAIVLTNEQYNPVWDCLLHHNEVRAIHIKIGNIPGKHLSPERCAVVVRVRKHNVRKDRLFSSFFKIWRGTPLVGEAPKTLLS